MARPHSTPPPIVAKGNHPQVVLVRIGARLEGNDRTRFRVWAPDRAKVEVGLSKGTELSYFPLEPQPQGYFEGIAPASGGTRYRYRLDGDGSFPDPCSRFQPDGPHGPSEVIADAFGWTDSAWKGLTLRGQVLYELHVGAFAGTYAGVREKLEHLKKLGVTCLELMPLATCAGRFNWGYDGVDLFAPNPAYGRPEELKGLINEAHAVGLGVILDVVYNHLGPDGNYLAQFAKSYFSTRFKSEWGESLNFDAQPVRDFVLENTAYWISEFHFDGLRVDATQCLYDDTPQHICADIVRTARDAAGPKRSVLLIAENEPQDVRCITEHGFDAIWVDDFHHSARVATTGRREAYFQDYLGTATELAACARHNSLYQGQWYAWQKQARGTPLRVPPAHAIFFLQNHDQIANSLRGDRLGATRAMTTLLLLLPQTPLLFMGQEWFAQTPFLFFSDFPEKLQALVRMGREKFLRQFESVDRALREEGQRLAHGEEAFQRSRLDWNQQDLGALALHRALLTLRREDPAFAQRPEVATLSDRALVVRYGNGDRDVGDRLLLLNLGATLPCGPVPEPLLAPPLGMHWRALLSSEDTRFGGSGALHPHWEGDLQLPGTCAVVLTSEGGAHGH